MSHLLNFTLSPLLRYSLKITKFGMRKKKIFRIYGCFSVLHIKGVENRVFRHNRIFRHTCKYKQPILRKWWNYKNFMQILYSYFKYTDMLLDVFFLLLAVTLSELQENPRRKD